MTDALDDLYQEVILDHYKKPRNYGQLPDPDRTSTGHNPLCGDRLTIYLHLDHDTVKDLRFEGQGCAISVASASLMSEALRGKTADQARELFNRFHEIVTGDPSADKQQLGKLAALAGVARYPARVKCATLAWHTLNAALENRDEEISTE